MQPIRIGNFDYTKDEEGNWIHKAVEAKPLQKVKAKYREKPQFPLQNKIEEKSKARFMKIMNLSVVQIVKHIKEKI